MSKKHLVCQGGTCKCNFGSAPDKLKVLTQSSHYINDHKASEKLTATNMDIGMTFDKNTFGQCKMQPVTGGFLPCIPALIKWDGAYEKVSFEENKGKPLLEDSKGTCAIAGSPCIEITDHGQIMEASEQNVESADEEVLTEVCPILDLEKAQEINIFN